MTVASAKGGVGKTTTAVYLAALLATRLGEPVSLVDADAQASASEWLELRPHPGIMLVEAPSERLVFRALAPSTGPAIVVDTPPGSERILRACLDASDVVVVPTRVGGVEISRAHATMALVPEGAQYGLVITAARPQTRDYRDAVAAWTDARVPVWASVPERVSIAAGPDGPLSPDGLAAYLPVIDAILAANRAPKEPADDRRR